MTLWATIPPMLANSKCCYCAGQRPELLCERCGAPFHDGCYWRTRPADEYRVYLGSPIEAVYMFVCTGCRN